MKLDTNTINKIAKLARISLSEEEANDLLKDMNSILDWVEQLNEVNTDSVEPLANISSSTLPQRKDEAKDINSSDEILKNSFYICYLIHRFFSKNYGIKFQYKWPNDLYYNDKKICGVVSTSKIIGNKSYIQTGIGFNLNSQPIKTSISLSKILNQKFPILEISSKLLTFIDSHLNSHISSAYLVKYLNGHLLKKFRVNHPHFNQNNIEIIEVLNDLSLRIKLQGRYENIFFGELI